MVCRQLGYGGPAKAEPADAFGLPEELQPATVGIAAPCTGREVSLSQCQVEDQAQCASYAAVTCNQ